MIDYCFLVIYSVGMDDDPPNRLTELIDKYKLPIGLGLIGLVLILGGLVASNFKYKENRFPQESVVSVKNIKVDISGAVLNPGVYDLNSDSRIEQVIQAAGGITEDANQTYISKSLNLAQRVSDGLKIYVPFEGETSGGVYPPAGGGVSTSQLGTKISINSATNSELDSLPGVGPVTSSKIVSGRPYSKIEELLDKKVVSKAVFEKIKELVVVN